MRFVAGQGAVAEFLLAGSCSGAFAGQGGAAEQHREAGAGRQKAGKRRLVTVMYLLVLFV